MCLGGLVIFMFTMGVYSFAFNRGHLLMVLFSLEFLVLIVYLAISIYLLTMMFEFYFLLVYLVFSVSEGVLGLSVLVSMVRSYGNDCINSLSILW